MNKILKNIVILDLIQNLPDKNIFIKISKNEKIFIKFEEFLKMIKNNFLLNFSHLFEMTEKFSQNVNIFKKISKKFFEKDEMCKILKIWNYKYI